MTSLHLSDDVSPDVGSGGARELHRLIDRLQAVALQQRAGSVDYDAEIAEYARAIRRMEALKLALVAKADAARVAQRTGLSDTTSWLAHRTRSDAAAASRDVSLAKALSAGDEGQRPCAAALSAGEVSPEHARVIVRATEQLPAGLAAADREQVERDLVEKARRLSPGQLRRAARRALEVVESDPALVDLHEDALLRDAEQAARAKTRLTLHDNGDGTTSGHFTVPTSAAAILRKVVGSMTSPRRAKLGAAAAQAGETEERLDWARRNGAALVEVLEHLPTDHLHSKVAATVVVTLDYDKLLSGIGAARTDTGDTLSASQVRRLACGAAGILPAVLDGSSLPLDLGRSRRLFSEAQSVALATRYETCAAEGCNRPFSWCELHHEDPWSQGGRTDLEKGVPLCAFHHHQIHDPHIGHRWGPDGIVFFRIG